MGLKVWLTKKAFVYKMIYLKLMVHFILYWWFNGFMQRNILEWWLLVSLLWEILAKEHLICVEKTAFCLQCIVRITRYCLIWQTFHSCNSIFNLYMSMCLSLACTWHNKQVLLLLHCTKCCTVSLKKVSFQAVNLNRQIEITL